MKFIDMFCGMGTIRLGMEQAGHECIYSVEWDKWKRKIYSIIFGGEPDAGDIKGLRGEQLPAADVWCFGAPCQDFSIAGTRAGLDGDRSSLVREVFRLVRETKEEHRPKYLIYENVKGMLSSNKGFDYLEILAEMASIGYDTIEYSMLNSKDFGVPQNRERVFTIGHLRGRSTRKVFPIERETNEYTTIGKSTETTVARTFTAGAHSGGNHSGMTIIKEVRACLTPDREEKRQNGRRFKEDGEPMFTLTKQDIHGVMISFTAKKIIGEVEVANTLQAAGPSRGLGNNNPITGVLIKEATKQGYTVAEEGDSINLTFPDSKTRRGRVGKGVAQTLDRSCNQGTLVGYRIRRLTPKECWRLQGVPDSITDKVTVAGISDTQMYRAAGDACTVNVIYEIAKRL